MSIITWKTAPEKISLREQHAHIWRVSLPIAKIDYDRCWAVLNTEERERAKRYYFDKDRDQFIASRGILRYLLTRYLQLAVKASDISFDITRHGKLSVAENQNPQQITFNVSHSGHCIVYAFTKKIPIGIDVEYVRYDIDFDGIVTRFFADSECAELKTLPQQQKYIGFYQAWTRKEAYIKAIGEGLSHPLKQFAVSLMPDKPAQIIHIDNAPHEISDWAMVAFKPYPDYFAAFTTLQKLVNIDYYNW